MNNITLSLTPIENLQMQCKNANDDIINAHNQLMRAQEYSKGLYKIINSTRSTNEKIESTKELRKQKKKSYECLGDFLQYVNTLK